MSIFLVAAIIGLLLPAICLVPLFKKDRILLRADLLFLLLQVVQIGSEKLLARNDLRNAIKYTAPCFVILRLIQLARMWRLKVRLGTFQPLYKSLLAITYFSNCVLWLYILFRLILRIYQTHS